MKIACSTVSCPGWSLEEAVHNTAAMGYLGLEMRTFDESDARLACNPLDMTEDRVEAVFDRFGIEPLSLATSVSLDAHIFPPVIGHIFLDDEAGVDRTKHFVDVADTIGARFVRIYPGARQHAEPRAWGDKRIGQRVTLAGQTARNTGVRVLLENNGSYVRAADLKRLVDAYGSQWTGVCYNLYAGMQAGDDPVEALDLLGDLVHTVRIKDYDSMRHPVMLGEGVVPVQACVEHLADKGSGAWLVYDYPNLWVPDYAREPDEVLRHASDTLYGWMARDAAAV